MSDQILPIIKDSKIEITFADPLQAIKLKNHWIFYDGSGTLVITKESPVDKHPDDVQYSVVIG